MQNEELIFGLLSMLLESESKPLDIQISETEDKGRYIVLGNRGNVVVGDLAITGSKGVLTNASVIRKWGTTKGLGQLALEGAQENTVLDACGSFEFDVLTTCGMIPVKSDL